MKPIKQTPTFRHNHNKGLYRISYQAPAGARRQGLPHNDKTDILNLNKVGGNVHAPAFIVTSLYDFENNFTELSQHDAADAELPTKSEDTRQ